MGTHIAYKYIIRVITYIWETILFSASSLSKQINLANSTSNVLTTSQIKRRNTFYDAEYCREPVPILHTNLPLVSLFFFAALAAQGDLLSSQFLFASLSRLVPNIYRFYSCTATNLEEDMRSLARLAVGARQLSTSAARRGGVADYGGIPMGVSFLVFWKRNSPSTWRFCKTEAEFPTLFFRINFVPTFVFWCPKSENDVHFCRKRKKCMKIT